MDANLRPTEEKWMLRTSEILVGSLVYLLLSVDKIEEMGLEFFLVRFIRRLMPAHVFFIFLKFSLK